MKNPENYYYYYNLQLFYYIYNLINMNQQKIKYLINQIRSVYNFQNKAIEPVKYIILI